MRPDQRRPAWRGALTLAATLGLLAGAPGTGRAQLRPLDGLDWGVFDARAFTLSLGAGVYLEQRASLAGTEGRLLELGGVRGSWREGRMAVTVEGTALRIFHDHSVYAPPDSDTRPPDGEARVDVGDYRLATTLLLRPPTAALNAALRFGVRLPTTDNRKGLGRDRTDFFATVGTRLRWARLTARAEGGIGVLGTRSPGIEQVDPVLVMAGLGWDGGWIRPGVEFVGQFDTRSSSPLRGTEDLQEIRLVARVGQGRFLDLGVTRGLGDFSPGLGLTLAAGLRR